MPAVMLRLEGAAEFIAATALFFITGGAWWLFLLFLLAPDLSALGYLAGPRIGSVTYNLAHTIAFPLALGLGGWWLGSPLAVSLALIWLAHIGMDRMVGYGFKYPDAFKHTHLDAI
jgi:hypothetical protein